MDVHAYYDEGGERDRLTGKARLEFLRTREILERFLPAAPARVLDVGGGPGAYAAWLAGLGHHAHVIDPVPLHVEQAGSLPGVTAEEGDARRLQSADDSWDAALLLGPLYHLQDRDDRLRALREARRVVRPGGLVAAATISRFASLLSGLTEDLLDDPTFRSIVAEDLRSGRHMNPTAQARYFTTAYFHHPDELRAEIADAGLTLEGVYAVEGPAWMFPDIDERLADDDRREQLLDALRAVEQEPSLLGSSAHMLAIAHRHA